MRSINLSRSNCMFVPYVLKQYAMQTEDLDNEDQDMGDTCRNGKEWDKCECC